MPDMKRKIQQLDYVSINELGNSVLFLFIGNLFYLHK